MPLLGMLPSLRLRWIACASALLVGLLVSPVAAEYPVVVPVEKTFDGKPFEYRIESERQRDGYVVYRLTYPSPVVTDLKQNNTVPAEYYVPAGMKSGDPKRPAVICIHILDGNMELVRMTCTVLAKHGIPSILFLLPYYGERGPAEGPKALAKDPNTFATALSQSLQDVRRTVDVLASRREIDPHKIGITGISLGGITAATMVGAEPRLSRAMLVLAGGDLLTMIHHARETDDLSALIRSLPDDRRTKVEEAIRAVDPLTDPAELRRLAQQGRVLMVNAAEDETIPRACTEKLAATIGLSDKVVWLDGLGHYTAMAAMPQMLERMVDFFAQDLPPGTQIAPAKDRRSPAQVVLAIAKQATDLLLVEPAKGHAHFANVGVTTTTGGKTYEGRVQLVRGWQGRFKLRATLPVVGAVAIGQGDYPWMASAENTVFVGTKNLPETLGDPLGFVNPEHLLKVRMASGAAASAALAPDILEPLAAVTETASPTGQRTIEIKLKKKSQGTLRLTLLADGSTPKTLAFEFPGTSGTIAFHNWQMDAPAHESLFAPPQELAKQEVDAVTIQRMFSAMFNFAMEAAQ